MTSFTVAAEPSEPHPEFRRHGVTAEYAFGFSVRLLHGQWLLRTKPFAPLEEFSTLEQVVERGEGLMTLYAPDAIIQNPAAAPIVGTEALRAFWSRMFSQFTLRVVPELQDVSEFGEAIIARGRVYGVMASRAGGAETPIDSWFLRVYLKQSDGTVRFWRGANGPNPTSP